MIITVFRSRLDRDAAEAYGQMAPRMAELAASMPGFIAVKTFEAADGERCTIVQFESHETHQAWADHPEHREAQRLGRESFYTSFDLTVAEVVHSTSMDRSTGGD